MLPARAVRRAIGRTGFAGDLAGVLLILAATAAGVWDDLRHGGTLVRLDIPTFFAPMYGFLGERLRGGDVPAWNPSLFAGMPFAGDPESGWMYLPAMLLFGLLPVVAATKTYLAFHLALAGLAVYALGRGLGLTVVGAVIAGTAYEFSAVFDRARCCPVYAQFAAWLPLLLLGTELALRRRGWLARGWWWAVAGLALSQILASWLGQGAYYALLMLGGYVVYRTLLDPPVAGLNVRDRLANLVLHGGAVLLAGFALGAAGVLPRLEFSGHSTLAGGAYEGDAAVAAVTGGWTPQLMVEHLLGGTPLRYGWYMGGATLALALVAPLLARRLHAVPYFGLLSLGTGVLTVAASTPLHEVLYALVPRFETLHRHAPERITTVFYLGPAILAGATVSASGRWRRPGPVVVVAALPIVALILLAAWARRHDVPIGTRMVVALVLACGLLMVRGLLRRPSPRRVVPILLLLVVFVDQFGAVRSIVDFRRYGDRQYGTAVDLATYPAPTGAAAFLERRQQEQPPFRFAGYDPHIDEHGPNALYRHHFADPLAVALLANNRALYFGLQDIQGYNPLHLARYREFVAALNGHRQEYHGLSLFAGGLDSPLLDLLNVRYLVVPARLPLARRDIAELVAAHPTVYEDAQVRVIERLGSLPRAWIVHAARQVSPVEALPLLAAGAVDPRQVALLEGAPPPLAQPADPAADEATITAYEPDRIRLQTRTDAPGLLVLSEVAYPAWRASVDGKPVPLLVADHLLRAVPVPGGEHTVELRYESRSLVAGLAISVAAYVALVALGSAVWWRTWRVHHPGRVSRRRRRLGDGDRGPRSPVG